MLFFLDLNKPFLVCRVLCNEFKNQHSFIKFCPLGTSWVPKDPQNSQKVFLRIWWKFLWVTFRHYILVLKFSQITNSNLETAKQKFVLKNLYTKKLCTKRLKQKEIHQLQISFLWHKDLPHFCLFPVFCFSWLEF